MMNYKKIVLCGTVWFVLRMSIAKWLFFFGKMVAERIQQHMAILVILNINSYLCCRGG